MDHLGASPWGAIALVSYIPDPLRSVLVDLQQSLASSCNPQPHITVLPPRPLQQSMEIASQTIQSKLDDFSAFAVELSQVRRFPETNFLYLNIAGGSQSIHELHNALNTGELAHVERFEFRPHLTLGGPFEADNLPSVQRRAEERWRVNGCSSRVWVDEITCLWLTPGDVRRGWSILWSHRLGSGRVLRQNGASVAAASRTY